MQKTRSWPMDSTFNRWMQIKRFSSDQMMSLHKIEQRAFEKEQHFWNAGRIPPPEISSWQAIGVSYIYDCNVDLGQFWPQYSTREWRESEIARFKKAIYRLWRPIWDKYEESAVKVVGQLGYISELNAIHKCDLAIQESAPPFPPDHVRSKEAKEVDDLDVEDSGAGGLIK